MSGATVSPPLYVPHPRLRASATEACRPAELLFGSTLGYLVSGDVVLAVEYARCKARAKITNAKAKAP